MAALLDYDIAPDPMIDVRVERSAGRRLIDEGRILHILAGIVCFDNESIEASALVVMLSCPVTRELPTRLNVSPLRELTTSMANFHCVRGERELHAGAVIRRIFERVTAQDIPCAIVNDGAGTAGIGKIGAEAISLFEMSVTMSVRVALTAPEISSFIS